MATRGIITLKVKESDKGIHRIDPRIFYFNQNECGKYKTLCPDIDLSKNYISITCQMDSYPSGAGVTLIRAYTDYDVILNLCLGGNISCLGIYPTHYVLRDGTFQYNEPLLTDYVPSCTADWQYLFDNGQWLARTSKSDFRKVEELL